MLGPFLAHDASLAKGSLSHVRHLLIVAGAEEQQEAQANEEALHPDEEKVEESDGVFTKV